MDHLLVIYKDKNREKEKKLVTFALKSCYHQTSKITNYEKIIFITGRALHDMYVRLRWS